MQCCICGPQAWQQQSTWCHEVACAWSCDLLTSSLNLLLRLSNISLNLLLSNIMILTSLLLQVMDTVWIMTSFSFNMAHVQPHLKWISVTILVLPASVEIINKLVCLFYCSKGLCIYLVLASDQILTWTSLYVLPDGEWFMALLQQGQQLR